MFSFCFRLFKFLLYGGHTSEARFRKMTTSILVVVVVFFLGGGSLILFCLSKMLFFVVFWGVFLFFLTCSFSFYFTLR